LPLHNQRGGDLGQEGGGPSLVSPLKGGERSGQPGEVEGV